IVGGLQTQKILGSYSSIVAIQEGHELPCLFGKIPPRRLAIPFAKAGAPHLDFPFVGGKKLVRILPGPQADWFPFGGGPWGIMEKFRFPFGASFTVSPASNRMGLRLQGPPVPVPPRELISEPVCPGTVQVTRDGQCIVLGVDAQTIGGYPKIAQVISTDLDLLGQARPGSFITFRSVSLAEAQWLFRLLKAARAQCMRQLRIAGRPE